MGKKRKKIIILYSTAGMGHKKAAVALFNMLKEKEDVSAELIDVLEYGNAFYNFFYLPFYVFLMRRARWLWGFLYYFSDNTIVNFLTRHTRSFLDRVNLSAFCSLVEEKKPDAVVATHFLLPSMAGFLKKKRKIKSKLYTIITDYGPHAWWLSGHIDKFFVGSEFVKQELFKRKIPFDKIRVTGIPTMEEFGKAFDVDAVRGTHGLDGEKKTIFLISGGFGVGPISKMLLSLNACRVAIQVIVVCGHNKRVYGKIELLKKRLKYRVILFAFTDKVAQLMAVSDLMITKAGGISVTEAMNVRLPMVLFSSIPGQESWNERFLISSGAAEKAERLSDIPVIVNRALLSNEFYESLEAGIEKARMPGAARKIVNIVLDELDNE